MDVVTQAILQGPINTNKAAIDDMSIRGTATSGTTISLTDTTQDWGADALLGKVVKIIRGENSYIREITGNTPDTMTFAALVVSVNATATIGSGEGSGEGAEGQIVLTCIGDLAGAAGNDVSVVIVYGDTNTGEKHAAFANNVLTFTIDTNGIGEQQTFAAGGVDLILAADGLDDKFSADENFTPGNLPIGGSAIDFTGGDDGVSPVSGDAYSLLYALDQDTIDAINASISELSAINTVAVADDTYALDQNGQTYKISAIASSDANAKAITWANIPSTANKKISHEILFTCTTGCVITFPAILSEVINDHGDTYESGYLYHILLETYDGGTSASGYSVKGKALS